MAIGRCIDCQHAFCPSHQALDNLQTPYTNLCTACLASRGAQARDVAAARAEQAAQAGERARHEQEAIKGRIADTARRLVRHGSPGLEPRTEVVGRKQTIPGWTKWKDDVRPLPPAWLVGEFDWLIHTPEWRDSSAALARGKWRTYVTPEGTVEPEVARPFSATGVGGIMDPRRTASLDAWREIEAAFSALARTLLRR